MRHPILVIYLVAVILLAWQPWNFWLIAIGVIWAFRSPDWASRWKFGPPLENSPLGELYASRHRSVRGGHSTPEYSPSARLAITKADRKPPAHREWRRQSVGADEAAARLS